MAVRCCISTRKGDAVSSSGMSTGAASPAARAFFCAIDVPVPAAHHFISIIWRHNVTRAGISRARRQRGRSACKTTRGHMGVRAFRLVAAGGAAMLRKYLLRLRQATRVPATFSCAPVLSGERTSSSCALKNNVAALLVLSNMRAPGRAVGIAGVAG